MRKITEINEFKIQKFQGKKKQDPYLARKYSESKKTINDSNEIWIFFDEFNTSVLQNYLAEIMIDRRSSLLPPHPKVTNIICPYLKILIS